MKNEQKENEQIKKQQIKKYTEICIIAIISMIFGSLITILISDTSKSIVKVSNYNKEYKEFQPLFEAYEKLKTDYYKDLKTNELIDGALNGMLTATGDKHTMYFNKKQKKEFEEELSGTYYGIGAEIQLNDDKTVSIKKIFDSSPAEKAGLKVNDIFLKIDGKSTEGKNASEVAEILRSSEVKTSTILIKRDNQELEIKVIKENITLFSVSSDILSKDNKKIGYIDVSLFSEKTYEQFSDALIKLEKDGMESLIIDLRGNSGGYLTTVTNMLSIFMDTDTVIYKMKTKNNITNYNSVQKGKKNYKVVILVDGDSASASEIMASSMKEKYGATLVGTTTYGKGTVQTTFDLSNESMIKYTIQEWLTPNGNSINEKGVTPDVEVELSEEYKNNPNNENDNQLQKALELLVK